MIPNSVSRTGCKLDLLHISRCLTHSSASFFGVANGCYKPQKDGQVNLHMHISIYIHTITYIYLSGDVLFYLFGCYFHKMVIREILIFILCYVIIFLLNGKKI